MARRLPTAPPRPAPTWSTGRPGWPRSVRPARPVPAPRGRSSRSSTPTSTRRCGRRPRPVCGPSWCTWNLPPAVCVGTHRDGPHVRRHGMTCPVCGTVAVPGARFCHNCGAALPAAAILPATERRVVTVLFGDLSDFTAWAEDLDPERVGAVIDRVMAALAGAVKTFGGHVDKLTGDGIMAVFGGVYAGERTSVATRHLASWRHLRPLRLKGKRDPVEAYELLGLLDAPGTRSGLGDEAPFVGRETELARVASRLAEGVDRGEPRVLIVTGEAGLGKTRLAAEIERFVARYDVGPRQPRVFGVRCAAFGELRRLAPLADLVRIAIGLPDDLSVVRPTHVTARASHAERSFVEERLRRLAGRLAKNAPEAPGLHIEMLMTLLGYGERTGPLERPGGTGGNALVGSEPERLDVEAVPAAVASLLTGLAAETPVLVMVDDLHDATPETVDALGATLSRLSGPVLVLLLGRPELVRTAGVLTRIADAEVTALPALRGADAARLLGAYLDGGRLPQAQEDQLLSTAQGNPFYLAELVTLLMERGALVGGPSCAKATAGRRPWSPSTSNAPSRNCSSAACCTASGAGTPSPRRCCGRPRTRGSARPTSPTGTPGWPGGRRPTALPRARKGHRRRRSTRSSPSTPNAPPRSPTRSGCAPRRNPGPWHRSAWPRSDGPPAGRSPRANRPRRCSTRNAPPRWPAPRYPSPTRWSTPVPWCSSAAPPTRSIRPRRSSPTPPTTRPAGPARCSSRGGRTGWWVRCSGPTTLGWKRWRRRRRPASRRSGARRCVASAWPTTSAAGWPRPEIGRAH